MEIEGLSLLIDLKTSLKKRLYRHIVNQVQRKFQRDARSLSTDHLLQILFKQIEAIHGLIDEVVIGKFEKNAEKIQMLVKIMNRNIEICVNIFSTNMERELINVDGAGRGGRKGDGVRGVLKDIVGGFGRFMGLVLESCYYVYILRLISGVNAVEFESFTYQTKSILNHLQASTPSPQTHQKISQTLLLLMSLNIKNQSYQVATSQFYTCITHLLTSLKFLQQKQSKKQPTPTQPNQPKQPKQSNKQNIKQSKNKQNKKCYAKMRRNLMLLIFVALVNYQRMLVESDCFVGWEVGFGLLKGLAAVLRVDQGCWRKYWRIQQEARQIIDSKKMQELRLLFIPYLTQQSQTIRNLLTLHKTPNPLLSIPIPVPHHLLPSPKRKQIQPKRTFYTTVKKISNQTIDQSNQSPSYTITYNQLQLQSQSQQGRNFRGEGQRKELKKELKKGKFPSIDWFSDSRDDLGIVDAVFSVDAQARVGRIMKEETERRDRQRQALKTQKKLKRSIALACQPHPYPAYLQPQPIQPYSKTKPHTKTLSKTPILHRLLTFTQQPQTKHDLYSKYNPNFSTNTTSIRYQQQNQRQRKSMEINYTEIFIKLLIQSKRKLHICGLVDRYELAKKRKKTRNYHIQILEFQLQKSISNFIIPGNQPDFVRDSTVSFSNMKKRNPSISNLGYLCNFRKNTSQKSQQLEKNQKIMAVAYDKSQQAIRQMLKKITLNHQKCQTRRSPKKSKNYSDLYISYRPFQIQ